MDEQNQEGVESLGWNIVYEAQYNAAGEPSWTPFAQAIQSNGVKGLVYTGEPENLAKLLQAIDDIGYELDWVVVGANHHRRRSSSRSAAPAVKNVYMLVGGRAAFLADENPADPAVPRPVRGVPARRQEQGATRLQRVLGLAAVRHRPRRSAAPTLTRKCVYEKAKKVTEWTGGGLHAPSNPSRRRRPRVRAWSVEATPDGFVVPDDFELTDGIFRCDDDGVVQAQG